MAEFFFEASSHKKKGFAKGKIRTLKEGLSMIRARIRGGTGEWRLVSEKLSGSVPGAFRKLSGSFLEAFLKCFWSFPKILRRFPGVSEGIPEVPKTWRHSPFPTLFAL